MSEWKPGDVAMVKFTSGHAGLAVFGRRDDGRRFDNCWRFGAGAVEWADSDKISAARPLVVIDPEDREAVERLVRLFWDNGTDDCNDPEAMQAALREFANPTPPKPDEPMGLGAVVEDDRGVRWVRAESAKGVRNPWQPALHHAEPDHVRQLAYADVIAVRVLSEGVPA